MSSGVGMLDECTDAYQAMKMGHQLCYVIFKINDNLKICVEEKGGLDKTYEDFLQKLREAESMKQCRYALYDVCLKQNDIEHKKLAFFLWSPDTASVRQKMLYASSMAVLRNSMRGIQAQIQCTDDSELAMSCVMEKCMSKYT